MDLACGRSSSVFARFAQLVVFGLFAVGCESLIGANFDPDIRATRDAGVGGDSSSSADGGTDASSGATGPGPDGALPSGYCCTSDDECRYRHCVQGNGTKFCSDTCVKTVDCQISDSTFTCEGAAAFSSGWCQPPASFTTCVPANRFTRGTRPLGACCTPENGPELGLDCQSAICASTNDGPSVCSRVCKSSAECLATQECRQLIDNAQTKGCFPLPSSYTCQ